MTERLLEISSVLLLAASLWSCTEVFEPDLTDRELTWLAPQDSAQLAPGTVLFWWEGDIQDASVRLQVVSPAFAQPTSILLDTLLGSDRFEYTLLKGWYQCRVRAENFSSHGPWSQRSFAVDTTLIPVTEHGAAR